MLRKIDDIREDLARSPHRGGERPPCLQIPLHADAKQIIDAAARGHGLSTAQWCRQQLLAAALKDD